MTNEQGDEPDEPDDGPDGTSRQPPHRQQDFAQIRMTSDKSRQTLDFSAIPRGNRSQWKTRPGAFNTRRDYSSSTTGDLLTGDLDKGVNNVLDCAVHVNVPRRIRHGTQRRPLPTVSAKAGSGCTSGSSKAESGDHPREAVGGRGKRQQPDRLTSSCPRVP